MLLYKVTNASATYHKNYFRYYLRFSLKFNASYSGFVTHQAYMKIVVLND